MYNIDQLNAMNDEQLREVAKSMGIKHVDSFNHDELVYQVLDQQAITEAANTPEPTTKRRRERIRQQSVGLHLRVPNPEETCNNVQTSSMLQPSIAQQYIC